MAVAIEYDLTEKEESQLEVEIHISPNGGLDEGDSEAVDDQGRSFFNLSMGGEGESRDAGHVSTTAVGAEGLSRDLDSDFSDQEGVGGVSTAAVVNDVEHREVVDNGRDCWAYVWEGNANAEATGENGDIEEEEEELDEEDDVPRLKGKGSNSSASSSVAHPALESMDIEALRMKHDDLVGKKRKEKVYAAEDLNEWLEYYRPLVTGDFTRGLPPVGQKWHVTEADDLNIDKLTENPLDMKWSPLLHFGTPASTKALNYISAELNAFVTYHNNHILDSSSA
jgi:hypothetical protein